MQYRRLGASGLRVSVIGLGGNTFGRYVDEQQTAQVVGAALDAGVNFFDTANIYSDGASEQYLGKALHGIREQALIATKLGMRMGPGPNDTGSSRKHIVASVHASLRRLDIDYIDLLQIHKFDPDTPLEETLSALDDLVRAGDVRYIGCSQYDAWRMTQALWISDKRNLAAFVSAQAEYNLLAREIERDLIPACLEFGVGVIPFYPLAAGVLTGKYMPDRPAPEQTRGYNNPDFAPRLNRADLETTQRLDIWARGHGHNVAELALAWLVAQPAVATVIAGVRTPAQVAANARAGEWALTPDDLHAIDSVLATPSAQPA